MLCTDSYFESVQAADEMKKIGLRFIGIVKTATRIYPMSYLPKKEISSRGQWHSMVRKNADEVPDLMAVVWVDRERRYFIANTSVRVWVIWLLLA